MFAGERSGRTGGVSRRKAAATPTTAESLRVHSLLRREFADWCQREGLESTLKALQKELGNKGITIGGTDSSCAPQPGNPSIPSTSTHAITSSSSAPQHGRLATVKKTGGIQAQAPKDTNTKGIAQSTTSISITESESGSGTDSDEESSDSDSSKSSSSSSSGESDSDSSKSSSSPTKSDKPAHLTAAKNTGGIAAQAPEKVIGQSTKPISIAGSESGSGTDSDEESSDSDSTAKSPSSSTKSGSDSSSSATKSEKPETLVAVKKTGGIITQTPKKTDEKKVIGQSTQPIVITGSDSSSGTESSDEESSDSDSSKSSFSSSSSSSSTEDSDSSTSSSAESDSDSNSDSSSSSSTESSSDSSNSSSSSSASSTSSSSTETDSDSRDQESLANPTPASNSVSAIKRKAFSPPQSPDAKRIKAPEPPSSATLNPPTASNSTQGLVNDGKQKKTNAPFRRVKAEEIALDQRLSDNSFLAKGGAEGSYGYKAHQDLIVTRGKAFTV
ncbi:hypothetical protein PCANC_03479 [Puccinia coronata f. sp. avenae]|uniref:Srp40 C-terminal domain-containing protein n=1 Tax=Puccinia coronata f. sp. avenae TaxID=200324 RepID=A0A2N5W2D4_9BASI|nr:hypothetical protein PCANC_03479 [Puccinia coronata f. sp. avenae]